MPRKIEIFTQGCPNCDETVSLVESLVCDSCEVTKYNVKEGCATNECRDLATRYGISRYPAIVVNGKLLDCCQPGKKPTLQSLQNAGIGAR